MIIHAGVHKTGTKAIQTYLAAHDSQLAERGILYPQTGRSKLEPIKTGHHKLAMAFERNPDRVPTLLARLRREIARSDADTVLLSSEQFSLLKADEIALLASELGLPIRIVFYYRKQSDFVQAAYSTRVCNFQEARDFATFAADDMDRLDFFALAERWADVCGRSNVMARSYDRSTLLDGNVIPDFLAAIGIEMPETDQAVWANQSLSWQALMSVAMLRRIGMSEPLLETFIQALRTADPRIGIGAAGLMSAAEAHLFDLRFAELNRAFHEAYCQCQPPIYSDRGNEEAETPSPTGSRELRALEYSLNILAVAVLANG